MEFEIQKSNLEQELHRITGITKRGSALASLSHIAVDAEPDGTLRLAATDLNISMTTELPANVIAAGSACIPASKLLDFVKLASGGLIRFLLMPNGWIQVKTQSSTAKLPSISRDQFPALPVSPAEGGVSVSSAALKRMISRTLFATSKQETNYSLKNLKMEVFGDSIQITAADGSRVAVAKTSLDNVTEKTSALIPDFTASHLLKLADGHNGDVIIQATENHLHFHLGKRILISSLSSGAFPDTDQIVLSNVAHSFEFNTDRLAVAIRRAAILASDYGAPILLDFINGEISSKSSDKGEIREEMPTDLRAPIVMLLNYKFLLDVLDNVRSPVVVLELEGPRSAVQIRVAGEEGSEYRCIIMPMALPSDATPAAVSSEEDSLPI